MEGASSNRVFMLVRVTAKARRKYKGYNAKNTYGALRIARFKIYTLSKK